MLLAIHIIFNFTIISLLLLLLLALQYYPTVELNDAPQPPSRLGRWCSFPITSPRRQSPGYAYVVHYNIIVFATVVFVQEIIHSLHTT